MNDIDNQQSSSVSSTGWLAGIIDGEGCIQLAKQNYKHGYGIHYRPQINITNCNEKIIEEVRKICLVNNLPFYLIERRKQREWYKRVFVIQIVGLQRVHKWLALLTPYLIGKRAQAEIMQQFIQYRLSLTIPKRKGEYSFGEKDEEFKRLLNEANATYRTERLNDYTPETAFDAVKV